LDYNTPRQPTHWNDRTQWSMLPWLQGQVTGRLRASIAAWPDTLSLYFPDAPPLRVVHGSPRHVSESIYATSPDADVAAVLAGVAETTVIVGHTHIAMDRVVDRWHVLNPGSVGVPLDGDLSASYMLLDAAGDGWRATLRRVRFNYAPLFAEFERQRFAEQCGVVGRLVLREFETARLQLLPFLWWRDATHPGHPLDPQLFSAFMAVDPRPYWPLEYQMYQ
jgi:hypothetical protein